MCAPRRALLALSGTAALAGALENGVGRTPAMGFSTWNTFGGSVSDALLRETADAMATNGLLAAGYEYLNLDDGWCVGRDAATGVLLPDPKLFTAGMKAVADYVHSRGLKFGIYTARGSTTCLGRPGADGHEVLDAATFAAWGVD
jgi:alpha-galactosidase